MLTSLQAMTIAHSPKTESIHTTFNVQSSPMQIYTDIGSNKYEGPMKDGKKHGKGKIDFTSKDEYMDDWVEGNRTRHGVYIYSNADHYELRYSRITRPSILNL
jgi:hypothetical protein